MYLILQQEKPEDYVIATGITTTVRDFVQMAFSEIGVEIEFKGQGINEKGIVSKCSNQEFQLKTGTEVIAVDERYFRPTEVDLLIGDPSKSKTKLGWIPKYNILSLVKEMVAADLENFKREQKLIELGYQLKNQFE